MILRTLSGLLLGCAALGLVACEDPTAPPGIALLLQVEVISAADAPASGSSAGAPAAAPGIESLDVGEVALAIGGLELTASTINGREDFLLEEPVVVPLRLSGDPTLALSTPVPTDEYEAIDVFVDKLDPGVPADDVLIEVFPSLEGASVLIRGTLIRDGIEEQFVFTSALAARRKYTFPAPRRFSSTFRSVALYTLTVNLDGWFDAGLGEFLDPNDPADLPSIEANILASMELIQG